MLKIPAKAVAVAMVVVAAASFLPSSVEARLGETIAECEARYGKGKNAKLEFGSGLKEEIKEISTDAPDTLATKNEESKQEPPQADAPEWRALVYSSRGLKIHVIFGNDRAVFIKYRNEAVFNLEESAPPTLDLTSDEIDYLKKANGGSGAVRHQDPLLSKTAPMLTVWKTSNGAAYSGYNRERKEFFACSDRFWTVVLSQIRAQVQQSSLGNASERLKGL